MKKKDEEEKKSTDLNVGEKYMVDVLNQLDDDEINIDKMASVTHQFLLISSIKDAKKVIEECQADGRTFYSQEQKNKKIGEMTAIFYEEKLKMLKESLFKE